MQTRDLSFHPVEKRKDEPTTIADIYSQHTRKAQSIPVGIRSSLNENPHGQEFDFVNTSTPVQYASSGGI